MGRSTLAQDPHLNAVMCGCHQYWAAFLRIRIESKDVSFYLNVPEIQFFLWARPGPGSLPFKSFLSCFRG